MHILKHVNYKFPFSMQKPFLTGLKLKNSLSNQLVHLESFSKSLSLATVAKFSGTAVDQLSTPAVTWAMPETISVMI